MDSQTEKEENQLEVSPDRDETYLIFIYLIVVIPPGKNLGMLTAICKPLSHPKYNSPPLYLEKHEGP